MGGGRCGFLDREGVWGRCGWIGFWESGYEVPKRRGWMVVSNGVCLRDVMFSLSEGDEEGSGKEKDQGVTRFYRRPRTRAAYQKDISHMI